MKKLFLIIAFGIACLFANSTQIEAQIVVRKPVAPRAIARPHSPGPGYVWITGHWQWNRRTNKYMWVKGHWTRARRGQAWVPGHWQKVPAGWKWMPGHWGR